MNRGFLRRTFANLPIGRKLMLVTLTICGVAMALAIAALFWFQSVQFRRGFRAELESLGAVVAQNCNAPLTFQDRNSALDVLSALKVQPYVTCACLYGASGELFAHFGAEDDRSEVEPRRTESAIAMEKGIASLFMPVTDGTNYLGSLRLRARYADKERELFSLYGVVMALVLGGALAVILLLSSFMKGLIANPIVALVELAREISDGENYSKRAPESARDEVGVLTSTFNRMLDQIQTRDARLRESQQRYEVAVMGSSDGLWDFDLVTEAVYYSPRWKSMLGYADGDLPNTMETLFQVLHPEEVERVRARVKSYLSGAELAFEIEFRAGHRDGSVRWILSRGVALRDGAGKPFRFAGSHTDITERKLAENELRVSREKFETLVNSIDGVVWEAQPTTHGFSFVSQKAEQLLGYPAADWLKEPNFWAEHLHEADREHVVLLCQQSADEGKPWTCEYRLIGADRRAVWIRHICSPAVGTGGTVILRGVLFDISEQKKAEEAMSELNRQLVDASRQAGMAEVATGVLHNVGNVLNSVNISANIILDQLRKSKVASLEKVVLMIRAQKENLGAFLTEDVKGKQLPPFLEALSLELSRERANLGKEAESLQENIEHIKQIVAMQQSFAKVAGTLETIKIHQVVEDALRMAASALARHQVEVVRQFDECLVVQVHRHKVLQILVNLLNNAKDALEMRPRDRRLTLRAVQVGDKVVVEVQDNGVGIAPEAVTRIFHHGFTTKRNGHGFGLHSGANAAKEMGGSLTAHSEGPGRGATFRLELCARPKKEAISPVVAASWREHI